MSLFITQCPHCHTSFRTTVSQLQSADGMVRCGACLRIFAADDNLLPSVDIRTVSLPTHEEIEAVDDEELAINEEQLPLGDLTTSDEEEDIAEEDADSIFTLDMADSLPNRVSPIISENDTSWQFIDEDDTPASQQETSVTAPEEEPSPAEEPSEPPQFEEAPEDESEDDALVRERMHALALDDTAFNEHSEHHDLSADDLEKVSFDEAPLELSWHEKPKKTLGITLLSLFLLICLALQTLWVTRHTLAQNAQWRPMIELFCSPLSCDLQPLSDISLIHSDQLAVQSHPEFSNALRVKMQFRNDAPFAQALPGILLKFTNSSNEVLAQRRFRPSEYLDKDLENLASMPAKSQLQVSLDLLDPGPQALNYEISFYKI